MVESCRWLALLTVFGCGEERATLLLPDLEGAASFALIRRDEAEPTFHPPDASLRLELETAASLDHPLQLVLLAFPCGVERVQSASELVRPLAAYSIEIVDAHPGGWETIAEVPDWAELRLPFTLRDARPCVSFDRSFLRLEPRRAISGLVSLDPERVLITTEGGPFFVLGPEGITEVSVSTTTPSAFAFASDEGDIWLADRSGGLARGHPDSGFESVRTEPWLPPQTGAWSFAAPSSEEVFVAVDHIVVVEGTPQVVSSAMWWDRGEWQTLMDAVPSVRLGTPAVFALGPGRALISLGDDLGKVYTFDERGVREELIPGDSRPSVFARAPHFGVVAGLKRGSLLARSEQSEWTTLRLETGFSNEPVRAIAPLDSGLLWVQVNNFLNQWFPTDSGCAFDPLLEGEFGSIAHLAPRGRGFVMAANLTPAAPMELVGQLWILERSKHVDACTVDDGGRGERP